MGDAQRDAQGRLRRCVYLPDEVWAWVDAAAERDGATRSDLIEGLVLLAQDGEESVAGYFQPKLNRGIFVS